MSTISESAKAYENLGNASFSKKVSEDKNARILDVRTAGEFHSGHIPGAINIDVTSPDFKDRIDALDKNKNYLVYCRSGHRSSLACSMLTAKGFKAFNLADGICNWNEELVYQ